MKREASNDLQGRLVIKIKLSPVPARIVLIGGGSASGKTTVAKKVCEIFRQHNISARSISMDNFYRSLEEYECGDDYNWDDIGALDCDRMLQCVRAWKNGSTCWIPRHNFSEYKSIDRAEFIIPTQIIILEGIHALSFEELVQLADLRLFITCDDDETLARRIKRDINERNYDIDTILQRYFTFVKPALRDVILPSQKNADYIIPNSDSGEHALNNILQMIISFMATKMQLDDI